MTALSPLRTGRVTGSRVGAILGVSKYATRDDVLREMVRQAFDAAPEFEGNDATAWGTAHEEDARAAYEALQGVLVLDAQEFITHPEHDWIGVSPDGLVGEDGMAEFKAPYRARYTSIEAKPDYYAQVQLQLAATGREWCDFVIWREGEPLIVERVEADRGWLPSVLPALQEFMTEFEACVSDAKRAAPHLEPLERSDADWQAAASRFHMATVMLDDAKLTYEDARARLLELAGEKSAKGCGVQVIRSERTGTVDYKKAVEKYAPDVPLDEFRKPAAVVYTVREAS